MFDKATLRRAALSAVLILAGAPAVAATMQCAPNQVIQTTYPTGSTYTAAGDGIVLNVANNDIDPLSNAGCATVGVAGPTLIGRLIGANMNVTTDQALGMLVAPNQNFQVTAIIARNCSTSLTTAAGAVWSAASKGGTDLNTTTQVYTGCTGATTVQNTTVSAAGLAASFAAGTQLYLSLTTAQGAAATADIYVYGYLGQ